MGTDRGQASIEVLALVPVMVLLLMVAVAVASMLAAASKAQDDARARAMAATGQPGATVVVSGTATVPQGGLLGWRLAPSVVRVGVRLP